MKLDVPKGTYVLAVSGGVDSMVLLDLLAKKSDLKLVVAHFDHGIRNDSEVDRIHVQKAAEKYKLPFVYSEGKLGPEASEAKARKARYDFLRSVQNAAGATAIITAHHQDDVIETAIINMLRGTKRLGLSSLQNRNDLLRPMLHIPKSKLISYAKTHGIIWREDSTNLDTKHLRNQVRHNILPKFTDAQRKQLLSHIDNITTLNRDINDAMQGQIEEEINSSQLDRHWFIMLPHDVSLEVLAGWLRGHNIEVDSKKLEILNRAAKTFEPGKLAEVDKLYNMEVESEKLALVQVER